MEQPAASQKWSNWNDPSVLKITLTTTYAVPCPTGWETKTTTIVTTHCGCTETPVPSKPAMTTIVTSVPEAWGVGRTVTVTVPVTEFPSASGNKLPISATNTAVKSGSTDPSSSWSVWSGSQPASVSTSGGVKTPAASSSVPVQSQTWSVWSDSQPASISTSSGAKTPAASSSVPSQSQTWSVWSTAVTPAAATTGLTSASEPSGVNGVKGIEAFKGAASSTAVGSISVVLAAVIAGAALMF
ncbi:hypothetical protein H2198_006536 [Neophaeococcomyces mojaviensis]|uniref:Uncharacterized protein n=1 Tax=Neophaeococcomyces mojaviensis TaxID=3383035 RepID=A0ACC3A334_9EURO|nr:hypothetical protein H2198_006536 [Knufia sp. JES_112]